MRTSYPRSFLPLFKFPTRTVLIDDSEEYIEGIKPLFYKEGMDFIHFTSSIEALDYLRKQTYCQFVKERLGLEEGDGIFTKMVNVRLRSLYQEIYNPNRFSEISVLVIDYAMPNMTGESFCQEVASFPVQKLLLTGEASYQKAIDMFNTGNISKYIRKDDESLDTLIGAIQFLQDKYFQDITQDLLFALRHHTGSCVFSDRKFIDFFRSLCEKYKFIEYYVADENGSYLLADDSGSLKLLIVSQEEDINFLYDFALDSNAPKDMLNALKEKRKIVFLQSEDDLRSVNDWELHDAQQIEGDDATYYYALVDVTTTSFRFDRSQFVTYQARLADR